MKLIAVCLCVLSLILLVSVVSEIKIPSGSIEVDIIKFTIEPDAVQLYINSSDFSDDIQVDFKYT